MSNNTVFTNLTPHNIVVVLADDSTITFPPSGQVARVSTETTPMASVAGLTFYRQSYGEVQGLPEPVEGTIFIVSALVRQAVPDRRDVASPGELIRGADGQPVGCRGLVVN